MHSLLYSAALLLLYSAALLAALLLLYYYLRELEDIDGAKVRVGCTVDFLRQYLYPCTSKGIKLSTFCTSKASKLSTCTLDFRRLLPHQQRVLYA